MHSHKAIIVASLLDNHLPHGYSKIIVDRAKRLGINTYVQRVRGVKALMYSDIRLLNLLVEFANENKAVAEAENEKLSELLTK